MKRILFALMMLLSVAGLRAQSYDFSFLDPSSEKGWMMNLEGGFNRSLTTKEGWDGAHEHTGHVFAGFGYNFNQNVYVGIESGVVIKAGQCEGKTTNLVPVMADVMYSLTTHKKWQPFLELRTGYTFRVNNTSDYKNYFVLDPRVGVKFRATSQLDLRVAVGYLGLWASDCPISPTMKNLDNISIQAGVGIHF